eukprot:3342022-Prymnesium_polylepis.2
MSRNVSREDSTCASVRHDSKWAPCTKHARHARDGARAHTTSHMHARSETRVCAVGTHVLLFSTTRVIHRTRPQRIRASLPAAHASLPHRLGVGVGVVLGLALAELDLDCFPRLVRRCPPRGERGPRLPVCRLL